MAYNFELPNYRYSTLFVCLIFFFIIMPFFDRGNYAQIATEVALLGLLAFFVYLVSHKRRIFLIATLLAVPATLGTIGDIVLQDPTLEKIGLISTVIFLSYVLWVFCANLFQSRTVDTNVIYGAICIYLLMAIEWGLIYSLLQIAVPGSFNLGDTPVAISSSHDSMVRNMIYYSFITLTTTGYGDITPLSQPARYFSMLESFLAQIYLTVLVARLVGMHIAGVQKSSSGKGDEG